MYFLSCLGKEISSDIETWSIDKVFSNEHFYGKSI